MTSIEWTDETWGVVRGCSVISSGCTNCYAMKQAHRFSGEGGPYEGLTKLSKGGPVWTGKVRLVPERLERPLHWRKPRRVFVNSMSDLFHEGVPDEFIDEVFAVMQATPDHTYQILTKRPDRMRSYLADLGADAERVCKAGEVLAARNGWCHAHESADWPLTNVWLGVSVENQETADERIPLLLQTPAAVRFVSYEPALGPVNFDPMRWFQTDVAFAPPPALDWIIVGGESGPGARPCHVEWIRSAVQQCRAARTACFVKQFGRMIHGDPSGFTVGRFLLRDGRWWVPPLIESDSISVREYVTSLRAEAVAFSVCDLKGGNPAEWPEDLRVREMPPAGQRRA